MDTITIQLPERPHFVYTVSTIQDGFPVFFLCPFCSLLHQWEEKTSFLSSAEAKQEFQNMFRECSQGFATCEYVTEEQMLLKMRECYGNGTTNTTGN